MEKNCASYVFPIVSYNVFLLFSYVRVVFSHVFTISQFAHLHFLDIETTFRISFVATFIFLMVRIFFSGNMKQWKNFGKMKETRH